MTDDLVSAAEDVVVEMADQRTYCRARDIRQRLDDCSQAELPHVISALRDRGLIEKWNTGTTGATWLITETNGS